MSNGGSRSNTFGGSGQGVPWVPFITIRAGSGGSVYANYGGGGGGVIIDNNVGPGRLIIQYIKTFPFTLDLGMTTTKEKGLEVVEDNIIEQG
jgi:hypothetical protein